MQEFSIYTHAEVIYKIHMHKPKVKTGIYFGTVHMNAGLSISS